MKYLILLIFTISLFQISSKNKVFSAKKKAFIQFKVSKDLFKPKTFAFYKGFTTGDKELLPKKLKESFKRYGLMHILTPSGIHLSSILLIPSKLIIIKLLILALLFFSLSGLGSYHSIERVLIFKFIFTCKAIPSLFSPIKEKLSIELIFFITIFFSLSLGHLQNPLSLMYSSLFWGTIILMRKKGLYCFIYMQLALLFSSSLFSAPINPMAVIINPLFTLLFTFIFPISFFNFIFSGFNPLNLVLSFVLDLYLNCFEFVINYNPFPEIVLPPLFCALLFPAVYKPRLIPILLLFYTPVMDRNKNTAFQMAKKTINLGHKSEFLKGRKNRIEFIDLRCRKNDFRIECKKKPSHLGGPVF